MNRTTRKPRPEKSVSETCPKCGYCDKCGRSNAAPVWPYPVTIPVPYVPPTNTWSYRPYWQPNGTMPITSVTISGTSTAPGAVASNAYVSKPNDPFVVGHAFTNGDALGSTNAQTSVNMPLSN